MKTLFFVLVLFCFVGSENAIAQGVRVNFTRYKTIGYNSYYRQWDQWPVKWTSSAAYAIISSVYDNTYKVSVYSNAGQHIVTSVCTYNSQISVQKRRSEGLPYLNCYVDREGDQIWTNMVSLESLLGDVGSWRKDGAALYLWIFNSSSSFAFGFE